MLIEKYNRTLGFPPIYTSPRGFCLEGGSDVQRVNMVPFYWLGNSVGGLWQALSLLTGPNSIKNSAWAARSSLEYVVKTVGALPYSQKAANDLMQLMDDIFMSKTSESHDSVPGTEDPLSTEEAFRLQAAILHFQAILTSELEHSNLYYVDGMRAYDMTVLINNGQWVLSQETLKTLMLSEDKNLTQKILHDVREAARCLAFGLPTGCGFHIFRAVEAVTLMYFPLLDIPYPDEKRRSLGTYIWLLMGSNQYGNRDKDGHLIMRQDALQVDERITGMLTHLKDFYRNPLAHPELSLDYEEAANTFQVAVNAIEVMVKDTRTWQLSDTLIEYWGNISYA